MTTSMPFLQTLWRVEVVVLACLLVGSVLFSVAMAALDQGKFRLEQAAVVASIIFSMGLLPATLVFGPLYAFLRSRGIMNLIVVTLVGGFPGVVMFFSLTDFRGIGVYAVGAGLIVGWATHAILLKWK